MFKIFTYFADWCILQLGLDINTKLGASVHFFIEDITKTYSIPIVYNFPAGHIPDNRALIFGRQVTLEVSENGTVLKFE